MDLGEEKRKERKEWRKREERKGKIRRDGVEVRERLW